MALPASPSSAECPKVALLSHQKARTIEGLRKCWETSGFEVEILSDVAQLSLSTWRFVWAELSFLNEDTRQFEELVAKQDLLVLVPYETHDSLEGLPGILSAPHFVMLPKPLIWHTFEKRMAAKKQQRRDAAPTQALRFAAEVEVMNGDNKPQSQPPSPRTSYTILLVEDNLVNTFV